jgi:cytochrome c6
MGLFLLVAALAGAVAGCAVPVTAPWGADVVTFESTYRRVLLRAERGEAESQNALGYMLYLGEGVPVDKAQALLWFERAARQGNPRARRNLAFVSAYAASGEAPPSRTNVVHAPAGSAARGEVNYVKYCGGCHGVNGIAAYENSPSFAFGERLDKPDAVLLRSLRDGIQEMPGWDGKLPLTELREMLAFARTLQARYDLGVSEPLRAIPPFMYLFGPMDARRTGPL